MIHKMLILIFQFVSRTIFVRVLGVEILGVNGIFSNILSVLSLAELGIATAIIYTLYTPIAEQNTEKISAIMNYYKIIYRRVALVVISLGILLIPFLDLIIDSPHSIVDLIIYYSLYLLNTVLSYFFVYKTAIVTADQKDYKLKSIQIVFSLIKSILQIVMLLLFESFFMYLIVQIISNFLMNYICSLKAERLYPLLKQNYHLTHEEKSDIWLNIKSLLYYKIGGILLNNTDNILISILVGTKVVGYYSNYSMIITQVAGFTSLFFISMQASFGNLNAQQDDQSKYKLFRVLDLLSFWIYGFCSIAFIILFKDFITLWLGSEFLISNTSVMIAVTTFYLQGVLYPIWIYRQTTGMFNYTKYTMLYASLINIILSIILGHKYGLSGILAATVLARLLTNIWYEPYLLHKIYFKRNSKIYFKTLFSNILIFGLGLSLTFLCSSFFDYNNKLNAFALKLLVCIVVPNITFYLALRKRNEFCFIYERFLKKGK